MFGAPLPWRCPRCQVYENPGPPLDHVCDERTVARKQASRLVTYKERVELERLFNMTGGVDGPPY